MLLKAIAAASKSRRWQKHIRNSEQGFQSQSSSSAAAIWTEANPTPATVPVATGLICF
jgi:hypothetical protein